MHLEYRVDWLDKIISMNKVYIIAEAGVNHNGKLDLALKLCDAAKDAGVDAVKFQTWKTEKVITKSVALADYQKRNISDKEKSQFQMLKKLELSYCDFLKIKDYCDAIGIQFLSTADEVDSLDFLCGLKLPYIKIGSGDINNINFLRAVGNKHLSVLLSTGMAYLSDVDIAMRTLLDSGAKSVTLLHCTTNYPCPMEEVNLQAMVTLKEAFKCHVGYSDHTMGIEVPIAAVSLGAEVIEKHFTLDSKMAGPDHKASLNPNEMKCMVSAIRNIEKALGSGIKIPNESEKKISKVVLKRIVASRDIDIGEIFSESNITVKRCSTGVVASLWDFVVGHESTKKYVFDQPIEL